MKKRLVLIMVAALFLSACGDGAGVPPKEEYPYLTSNYYYCKKVDEEKRIMYDCMMPAYPLPPYTYEEIHLGANTNWAKR